MGESSTKEKKENVAPANKAPAEAEACVGRNLQRLFDAERGLTSLFDAERDGVAIRPAEFERAAEEVDKRCGQRQTRPGWGTVAEDLWSSPQSRGIANMESGIVVPAGYRLVPDEERRETLAELRQKIRELDEKYARL